MQEQTQATQPDTALARLHDITMPEHVAWIPQTAGWYIMAALFAAGLVAWGFRLYRRHRANAYRRMALAELDGIEMALGSPDSRPGALGQLVVLVKRTALMALPRSDIAALTGDAWLAELDRSYSGTGFTSGAGRVLPELAYDPGVRTRVPSDEIGALLSVVRDWIRKHKRIGGGTVE